MKLLRLTLGDFAPYKKLAHDFASGLSLFTGANGAGKSSLIEGVAWALYGQTIRGADRAKGKARLVCEIDGREIIVERNATGKAKRLTLEVAGVDKTGATTTETQERVEAIFGSWLRFSATRLFAKEFLVKFNAATDKGRKQLLEEILGLGQFDRALEETRRRANEAEESERQALSASAWLRESVQSEVAAITAAESASPARPLPVIAEAMAVWRRDHQASLVTARKLEAMQTSIQDASRDIDSQMRDLWSQRQSLERELGTLAHKAKKYQELDICPTCLQVVGDEQRKTIGSKNHDDFVAKESQQLALKASWDALHREQEDLSSQAQSIRGKATKAKEALAKLESTGQALERELTQAQGLAGEIERRRERVAKLEADLRESEERRTKAAKARAVLRAAVDVFGLRGARVVLLAQALGKLEAAANQVLTALGLGMALRLSATSKLLIGREVDVLSIEVEGDCGRQYAECSSGERSRLDVAILLALAALGRTEGWIAFDEVFDSLDSAGVERVGAYLSSLGATRQIAVVTHHADLRELFPMCSTYEARRSKDGAILVSR